MSGKTKTKETAADGSVASADWLAGVRADLGNTVEDIGQALGLLREACNDMDQGNEQGAKMSASDAGDILAELECTFSGLAARVARVTVGEGEEESGTCLDCGARLELVRPGKHQCPECG